jgi:peroxiredoxin
MKRILVLLFLLSCIPAAHAGDVPDNARDVRPLLPGDQAPAFSATDAYGNTYRFDPAGLERPAVLVFYRGGWCPFCNVYWADLRKAEEQLLALDLDLIFISADSPEVLSEAVMDEQDKPSYQLLSDSSSDIAKSFGIAFRVDDKTYERYLDMGLVDLEKAAGGYTHHNLPVPATYIVSSDGTIRFAYVNPNYKVRLHPDVLVAAARTMPEYRLRLPKKD